MPNKLNEARCNVPGGCGKDACVDVALDAMIQDAEGKK